jgi:hypothetical protein
MHLDRPRTELTVEEEELARNRWGLVIGLAVVLIAAILTVVALIPALPNFNFG